MMLCKCHFLSQKTSKFIKIVTFDTNVTQAERKKVTGYCDVQKRKSYLFRDYSEKVRVAFHDAAYWVYVCRLSVQLSV